MNLLLLDTSTDILLLGLWTSGKLLAHGSEIGRNHGVSLAPGIQEILTEAGLSPGDLNAIACTSGPGSFTGLRIGLATAKGLTEALGIPLVGIVNLDAMGMALKDHSGKVACVIDARKNRIYARLYQNGRAESEVLDISPQDFYLRYSKEQLILAGPLLDPLFSHLEIPDSWRFLELKNWIPGLAILGCEAFERGDFLGPGEGPYYHRFGEEDLGISPVAPKLVK